MDQFVGRMLRRIHARNGISKGYRIPFFIQLMALDESFVLHWRLISPQLGPWGTPSHEISGQKRLLGDRDFLMWIMNSNSIRCQVHAARVMGEHRNSDTVSLTLQICIAWKTSLNRGACPLPPAPEGSTSPLPALCGNTERAALSAGPAEHCRCFPGPHSRALGVFYLLPTTHVYSHTFSLVFLHVTSAFLYRIWPLDENVWLF